MDKDWEGAIFLGTRVEILCSGMDEAERGECGGKNVMYDAGKVVDPVLNARWK